MHYGVHNSRLSPKAYTITFICSDFIALVLQSAGGAIADEASTIATENTGTNIMVAGLSFQVISLTAFILLCTEFFFKVKNDKKQVATNLADCDIGRSNLEVKGFHVFLGGKLPSSPSPLLCLYKSYSFFSGHRPHLNPLLLPCRRACSWVPRQTRE